MLQQVLRDGVALERYRHTPLGAGLDAFADFLVARGHPRKVAAGYLRLALHFAHWVQRVSLPRIGGHPRCVEEGVHEHGEQAA